MNHRNNTTRFLSGLSKSYLLLLSLFILVACNESSKKIKQSSLFIVSNEKDGEKIDAIPEELIFGTISSPETFYTVSGHSFGLDNTLAQQFAQDNGIHIRFEIAHNVNELCRLLKNKDIDVIAFNIPDTIIQTNHLEKISLSNNTPVHYWVTLSENRTLSSQLQNWIKKIDFSKILLVNHQEENNLYKVKRTVHPPYISRERGVISVYDNEFKTAAQRIGWDWKLLAAQCYQESAFDPNATSYAGAKGLMQIMPSTAEDLGVKDIYSAKENIQAGAKFIAHLNNKYTYIQNQDERIKFILAAYNAGPAHILDAQNLAKKYGKSPTKWDDVSFYILHLSKPEFYQDASVKYGYMKGEQTTNYVNNIIQRWKEYKSNPSFLNDNALIQKSKKNNRFTKNTKIIIPQEQPE